MSEVPFLDLRRSVAAHRERLDRAVAEVLDGGRFVLDGAVERFEREWAEYCGAAHGVGVASGTDAIALALAGVGVGPGDEVVVPANTCVPTVVGIEGSGATPVLADVDELTCTLDPASLEDAVTGRTKAVVAVHLYGRCAAMDELAAAARAHGLALVEDAAQAHGAELGGRRPGTLGDVAAFSFYPTKNLGALGDAGAVVTDDAEVADRVRALRAYGERDRYESVERGRNSRLDELQAALLSARLPTLPSAVERRRALAARYRERLAEAALELPEPDEGHAYHLFVVRLRDRDRVRSELAARGVQTLVHYPRAVHEHPAYRELARPGLGRSERLAREVLSLPLYPELEDGELDRVADALLEVVA